MLAALRLRLALALAAGILAVVVGPWLGRLELLTFDWRQRWLPAELSSAVPHPHRRHRRRVVAGRSRGAAPLSVAALGVCPHHPGAGPGASGRHRAGPAPPRARTRGRGAGVGAGGDPGGAGLQRRRGGAPGGLELEGPLPGSGAAMGGPPAAERGPGRVSLAMARVEAEEDGVTRRVPLVANNGGHSLAAVPAALAARAGARLVLTADGVQVGGRRVTGADGSLWPRFVGGCRELPVPECLGAAARVAGAGRQWTSRRGVAVCRRDRGLGGHHHGDGHEPV